MGIFDRIFNKKNNYKDEYEIFFSNNENLLCITNEHGNFIKLNNKFASTLNYKENNLHSKKYIDFIHPNDIQNTILEINKLDKLDNVVYTNRYKINNTNNYVRLQWNTWKKDKKLYYIAKDITDEYYVNNKLRESNTILQKVEELVNIGSWKLNIITKELTWTNGLKKIYDTEKISYDNYMDINHPNDREIISETISKCIKEKTDFTFTHRLLLGNKIKYLYAKGQYIEIHDEPYIICVAQDISERTFIELDLVEAKNKAENSSKMKSEFVANISHEIRTPINGIIGMTNLLSEMDLNDEEKECIDVISHSSGVLLSIINNVLDFSKIEAGKILMEYTSINIRDLLDKKKIIFNQRIREKKISFNIYVDKSVPEIIISDSSKIQQILSNLINNAIKFTDYGGISIIINKDNNQIEFTIKDSGVGIPLDIQNKLFKPFIQGDNTTTRTYGGTGLGLSICRSLINTLNGKISLKSYEGMGTTVTFSIPLENNLELQIEAQVESQLETQLETKPEINTKFIIIVEDNKTNQVVTTKTLEKLKFNNYKVFENGEIFIRNISSLKNIGLILMDLHMPKMDGYTCTKKIRELGYNMPIIASTANAMLGEKEKCLDIGMNDFLLKPVQLINFKNMIDKWLT